MRKRWILAGPVVLLALTSGLAMAQGRGHGRGHDDDEQGYNRGQARKAERERAFRFDDRDRGLARNWYFHERRDHGDDDDQLPPGLRGRDRLPPGWEARLRPGYVIERDWRDRLYPAPLVLIRSFPPPPPGCRYVIFGGNLLLVDPGYHVADVIHLELNLGG